MFIYVPTTCHTRMIPRGHRSIDVGQKLNESQPGQYTYPIPRNTLQLSSAHKALVHKSYTDGL